MTLTNAKEEFIQAWGGLGSKWGINRTMAQIHALMMISDVPVSTEDVMDKLGISRGNANINLRALVDWNLIMRTGVKGERREYFIAEKDIWRVAMRIANERKKRELDPILKTLENIQDIDIKSGDAKSIRSFKNFLSEMQSFAIKVDGMFNRLQHADRNWFTSTLVKFFK